MTVDGIDLAHEPPSSTTASKTGNTTGWSLVEP